MYRHISGGITAALARYWNKQSWAYHTIRQHVKRSKTCGEPLKQWQRSKNPNWMKIHTNWSPRWGQDRIQERLAVVRCYVTGFVFTYFQLAHSLHLWCYSPLRSEHHGPEYHSDLVFYCWFLRFFTVWLGMLSVSAGCLNRNTIVVIQTVTFMIGGTFHLLLWVRQKHLGRKCKTPKNWRTWWHANL